jgi:CHAD domain-containing protein
VNVSLNLEREVKLDPNGKLRLGDLGGEPLEPRQFTSTYYDTDDHLLARIGMTFRRRVENGLGVWQLKLPRSGGRLEVEQPGGPVAPPEPVEELLAAILRGRALRPVAQLRTLRRGVRIRSDEATADVVLDEVAVMEDLHVESSFDELEIELVEGDPRGLAGFEKLVRRAGAEDGDPRPKVMRVLALGDLGETPARPQLQAYFRHQYEEILAHDPGTRRGDDPEDLHDMRVAVRRLRAIIKVATPPLDPEWTRRLREQLDRLGDALGSVRDLDVMLEYVKRELGEEAPALKPLLKRLERQRSDARRSMLALLRSARYTQLLDALEEAARRPLTRSGRPGPDTIARKQFAKLREAVRKLDRNPSDEELHEVRIKGKRARYAAELAEPGAGKKAAEFLKAAKRFQDVVGEHQDAVVVEQRVRELAAGLEPETSIAAGRLVERQRIRKRTAREELPKAWKKLEQAGKKAWA